VIAEYCRICRQLILIDQTPVSSERCRVVIILLTIRQMSHLQFYHATLVCDKIASVTRRVSQLFNSRATLFPNRSALSSVQLCRENAVNADWSLLVYATQLQCATRCDIAGVTSVLGYRCQTMVTTLCQLCCEWKCSLDSN